MRPLTLHVSALNDDEYALFTSSLIDLAASDTPLTEDAHFEKLSVSIREARAWLRGRYADLPVADLDEILRLFAPNPGKEAVLSGGQFFAVLRLVLHVRGGAELDRNLVFSQVHLNSPKNDLPSPTKPSHDPPPRHISITRTRQASTGTVFEAPTSDTNPFTHHNIEHLPQPPVHPDLRSGTVSSPTIVPIKPPALHHASNPFVARAQTLHAPTTPKPITLKPEPSPPPTDRKVPPLPPRKPPPLLPPRNQSLLLATPTGTSTHFHTKPPPPPVGAKVPHLTTELMKQSLQASKAAQDAKRAEAQREQARVLQVLKSSSTNGHREGRSISPSRYAIGSGSRSSATSRSSDDRIALIPPTPTLPPRRQQSPPPSSAMSSRSFEQVASARLPVQQGTITGRPVRASPPRPLSPLGRSPSHSPSRPTMDLPPPPPLHPDRKTPASAAPADWGSSSPSQTSPRVSRSKSMHYSAPPVPPPLRRRPESVQVPSSGGTSSPGHGGSFFSSSQGPPPTTMKPMFPKLSRHMSMSARDTRERSWDREDTASEPSPMAQFQKTFSGLGPRLDAARYKAEAGLSKRGYGRWREEGQAERLVSPAGRLPSASSSEEGLGMDGDSFADDDGMMKTGGVERDGMKWPSGDGWKPLA